MRADLSKGCVENGVIHCPLHDWQYAGDGRCVRIPASEDIPPFAKQISYPAAEIGGHVVYFNAPVADYPLPFFDGRSPGELCPAAPFDIELQTPWYLVGANGFDIQHFRIAHDRTLIDTPVIDSPAPFARRMIATYDVTGAGFRDALTRRFAGPQVRMSVTSWAGVNICVSATFERTSTHGIVFVRALEEYRTLLRTIVWIPRHSGALGRMLIDPLAAFIRRWFIQAFLLDDAARSNGARYNPATLIDADREMKRYLDWLESLSSSGPQGISVQLHTSRAVPPAAAAQEGAV
jgi:phenylpropionate dioxygenase-like ring-hydroxylating dioxygenase large terminal subunit